MYFFKKAADLNRFLDFTRDRKKSIGFVPTLGALHSGHLSLIEQSKKQCGLTVCSIFVNPTQFNDPEDLKKYPRTFDADVKMLASVACDVLFYPDVEEVYPAGLDTNVEIDLGSLGEVLEGAFRPGHFEGVLEVVKRLLDLVGPDRLYMGQKDYQQFAIIREMIRQLKMGVEIVRCPIIREEDGLAMSSRNRRLTDVFRQKAPLIHRLLSEGKSKFGRQSIASIEQEANDALKTAGFNPEYFSIVDGTSLLPLKDESTASEVVACTAVWAGDIRLIDNMIYRN